MLHAFRKLNDLMESRERRRAMLLLGMILVMGILEASGVASIMPFMAVLADPSVVERNRYLSALYNWLGFERSEDFLVFLGLVAFLTMLGSTGFRALTTWAIVRFTSMRNYALSRRLFRSYLYRPYAWFLGRHSADLGKTVLSEVSQVINGALMPAMQLVAQAVVAMFLVTLLLIVDPLLTLTVTVVVGGTYWLIFWARRRHLSLIGEDRVRANLERFRLSSEALGGIKEVKVLGLEEAFLSRFEKPSLRFVKHQAASQMIAQLPQFALQVISFGGILLIVQYQLLVQGSLGTALPLIALYAVAGYRMLPALNQVYMSASNLRFALPALEVLHADLVGQEMEPWAKGSKAKNQIKLPQPRHRLELRDVSYRYPGATSQALNNVSMSVRAYSTVGLVGRSGAGKTTAVEVILGLLEPQEGDLLVDNTPITNENKRIWQRYVGYVPQAVFLVDDTVAANIALGIPSHEIDMESVERAARLANLHSFVIGLDQGYDTLIGERGVRFSGGERQRVGIARALYRDPDVIIMDEGTSALDNITERAVIDAVGNLRDRKTIILIAHRLTTIRRCDTIFLFEDGRIIAGGTYDQLVDGNNRFQAMVEIAFG